MDEKVLSVGQVNHYLAGLIRDDFLLSNLSVRGEISNCKYHSSGHIYFTLKDDKAALSAVMFAGNRRGLTFPMKDGDEVIVTGNVDVFERDGKVQIYAKKISLAGAGDLNRRFEELKRNLEEMGMFDESYKKPIPEYAKRVGIVTAPTGAAVRDIIRISKRRNPAIELILFPALVQGEGAVNSICKGIATLDLMDLDVIIVGRGGGSLEDLWAFNEEAVAREIFAAKTPIISAVGHETDTTISDFVADMRASTPSAAAELAVYDQSEIVRMLATYSQSLDFRMKAILQRARREVERREFALSKQSPMYQLTQNRDRLIRYEDRLSSLMDSRLLQAKNRLSILAGKIDGLSPAKKLESGFSFVTNEKGEKISSSSQLSVGDEIDIRLHKGSVIANVTSIQGD